MGSAVNVPPSDVHGPGLPFTKRRYQIARSMPRAKTYSPVASLTAHGSESTTPPSGCGTVTSPLPGFLQYQTASSAPRPKT